MPGGEIEPRHGNKEPILDLLTLADTTWIGDESSCVLFKFVAHKIVRRIKQSF